MAIFNNNPDERQRLDWRILQNGWTSLYCQQSVLEKDITWFRKEKYNIIDFDCRKWSDTNQIHKDIKEQFDFPDYYGKNLNALNDCFSDLEINSTGIVIVFRHFQIVEKSIAHGLLDIFARNSRLHSLFGQRLLLLVQVDDPNYAVKPVGSYEVLWNDAEWLNSKREL
jgi:RNAse (barnase) inhibitor barstar